MTLENPYRHDTGESSQTWHWRIFTDMTHYEQRWLNTEKKLCFYPLLYESSQTWHNENCNRHDAVRICTDMTACLCCLRLLSAVDRYENNNIWSNEDQVSELAANANGKWKLFALISQHWLPFRWLVCIVPNPVAFTPTNSTQQLETTGPRVDSLWIIPLSPCRSSASGWHGGSCSTVWEQFAKGWISRALWERVLMWRMPEQGDV